VERVRAIVLADGDRVALPLSGDATIVIAADGGLGLAAPLGLDVSAVVGDMDSVDPAELAAAEQRGVRIERHPEEKDATDLELALDAAIAAGADDITVVGGSGGRLDHLLANAQLLTSERYDGVSLRWLTPGATVTVCDVKRMATVDGAPGDLVSLIPIAGPVSDIDAVGLRWPLEGAMLDVGSTRGVSNVITAPPVTVSVGDGTLLVVHQEALT
jgi:thiamine pyrophosphokinase